MTSLYYKTPSELL